METVVKWLIVVCLVSVGTLAAAEEEDVKIDPKIIESILTSKLELLPDTETYNSWLEKENSFEVFLFNWTNPEKFPGVKPHLDELGPYRFREYRKRIGQTWYDNGDKMGYRTFRKWVFDETSPGKLNDKVTTVDYIAASLAHQGGKYQSYFIKFGMNIILRQTNHNVSVTKTARELLFDGYEDPVLTIAKNIMAPPNNTAFEEKFGWFYKKNNSVDSSGDLVVSTGQAASAPGQILEWKTDGEQREINKYYEGPCSRLEGSVGDFMPRDLTKDSELKMFMPELCRSVALPYVSSGQFRGLDYHKFGLAHSSFDKAGNNSCFCNGPCEWEGVMNVTACRNNEPLFVSLPHFLHGDPRLLQHFQGLRPDAEKHSYYYAVEPRTGIPLDVAVRYQLNVYMEPDTAFELYKEVPRLVFPVLWVQELSSADQSSLEALLPKTPEAA